jgi:hypothetical protein
MMLDKSFIMTFLNDNVEPEDTEIHFFERNPTGRGLDVTYNPDLEEDFLRYAVQLHFINPVKDAAKTPLPSLEDLARGAAIQLRTVISPRNQATKEL